MVGCRATGRPFLQTSFWFGLGADAAEQVPDYAYRYLRIFGDDAARAMAGLVTATSAERVRTLLEEVEALGCDEVILVATTGDSTTSAAPRRRAQAHSPAGRTAARSAMTARGVARSRSRTAAGARGKEPGMRDEVSDGCRRGIDAGDRVVQRVPVSGASRVATFHA